ncbi:unnamed protein product [Allacma fusca]|uniref:CARMIL pleckstrin homology domain-containing protein n=1 Tax=Allacma fusca TaxID=39272 RepID=A0A8J2JF48_9HEXA|nr:unnamed protein product [Allacma fusca]
MIDFHFHYLEIQAIESKKPNQMVLTANDKSHSFVIPEDKFENIDRMIVTLLTSLSETFPGIPLYNIIRRIDVVPAKRLQHLDLTFDGGSSSSGSTGSSATGTATTTPVSYPKSKSTSSLEENVNIVSTHLNLNQSESGSPSSSAVDSSGMGDRCTSTSMVPSNYHHVSCGGPGGTIGPCGGFSTQYAWMCDLHGLPYREEVAWRLLKLYATTDCSFGGCKNGSYEALNRISVPTPAAGT